MRIYSINHWSSEIFPTAAAIQNPRYEANEHPPIRTSIGLGWQFSLIASATLLVTPVIVAEASDLGEGYVIWMVFASLIVVGISTLIQTRRIGPVGAGIVLPMFTAAFAIPFCISAVVEGGPATLTSLVIVSAIVQLVVSRWLFVFRRVVTPIVSGTVMMILSITLASVVFKLLDDTTAEDPVGGTVTAFVALVIVAALALRGSALLRLWGPPIGIVGGCIAAAFLGIYDVSRVVEAPWIGLPQEWPGLEFEFGVAFWTLLPSYVFLGIIIAIQTNGAAVTAQNASFRGDRSIDFRGVQGAIAGSGVSNLLAGIGGTVPNAINPAGAAFMQTTGVASRHIGYAIGLIFILLAFVPKASGLLSTIPGPVMTGYLVLVTGTLFADGARTVIQSEPNPQKLIVAGMCFWIGAAFQFRLFDVPDLNPILNGLMKSGITTGGFAAIAMILYLELTNPRRMRFRSKLDIDSLPELNDFITKFANSRRWGEAMRDRLMAVGEETLLTLAPMDFNLDLNADDDETDDVERTLVVVASSDGDVAELEFIGGEGGQNIEDRVRQLQDFDDENIVEQELSLQLLRNYASSVQHQQYHGTDIITVRIEPPGA